MTATRRALIVGALGVSAVGMGSPAAAQRGRPLSLRRGVNLFPWFSLTREYPAPRTDYAWPPFQTQRPVPTRRDLAVLRRIGLDFVRIPVDPGPFLSGTPRERATLIAMLSNAVRDARDADLSVVVNIQANSATHHWNPAHLLAGRDTPAFAGYRGLACEIAAMLARQDVSRIALEPVNEPYQACGAPEWLAMQEALLAAIRDVGADLTLVATGSCGSMVAGLDALDPAPLARFGPLLFTFHFYEPYLFSHQGAPWMSEPVYKALNGVPWPAAQGTLERTLAAVRARMAQDTTTSAQAKAAAYEETRRVLEVYFDAQPARPFIDGFLDTVSAWGRRHGVAADRILMGEFGALRSDARYVAAGAADRERYVADVRRSAEAHGFPWAFWNLFDGMGMMDDTTRALDAGIVRALGLAPLP